METGLVLGGGGARAAYQAGVLAALAEILPSRTPFRILAGVSAGAINAAVIATAADDFPRASASLSNLWAGLTLEKVYRTDTLAVTRLGARWLRDLSGLFGGGRVNALLDTAPLRSALDALPLFRIPKLISAGMLHGLAITATRYRRSSAVSFFDGHESIQPWTRLRRIGIRSPITATHLMASAAIPIFFPPVKLRGSWYGDGCVRLTAPISPAIHLGADRIVTIGVHPAASDASQRDERKPIAVAEIAGAVLEAVFLDSLGSDLERLERINRSVALMSSARRQLQPLRVLPVLSLTPSRSLSRFAADELSRFPIALRHLLRGLGADKDIGWDLVSYLAFDPGYIRALSQLGYDDTWARAIEIRAFFESTGEPAHATDARPL